MRYLFLFFLFFSYFSFAGDPIPDCQQQYWGTCTNSPPTCESPKYLTASACPANMQSNGKMHYRCFKTCSCPEGFRINRVEVAGSFITQCVPDVPTPSGPDDCTLPQVFYAGLCRDSDDTPDDCDKGGSAIAIDGRYVCSDNPACPDGSSQGLYSNANGVWTTCTPASGDGDDGDDGGGASSTPSSSPSGDGDGGGDDGTGGGSGGGDGSGNNGSAAQASSVPGGGGGIPPFQNSSRTNSSAHGAASSGNGVGNCDPTAEDYLACISRKNPGEGDGGGDSFYEPSGAKGEFDGVAAQERREELEQEIKDQIETIRDEITDAMGGEIRGSGTVTDKCVTVFTNEACFGLAKFSDKLKIVGQAFFLVACVFSFSIVMRN